MQCRVVDALCGFGVWACGRACDILHETLLEDMLKDPAYAVLHTNSARHCSLCVSHLTWVLVPCRDRLVAPAHKREALNPETGEVAVINVTNPMVECNTIRAILAEVVSVPWRWWWQLQGCDDLTLVCMCGDGGCRSSWSKVDARQWNTFGGLLSSSCQTEMCLLS